MMNEDIDQKFDKKMRMRRRRQLWKQRLKMVAAAVILMLIGATVFGSPQDSRAFSPVYRIVQQVTGDLISFVFRTPDETGSSGAKTIPPPGYDANTGTGGVPETDEESDGYISIRKTMTLEEARNETLFSFYVPEYIPDGFELKVVEVYYARNSEKGHMIGLWYEGKDDQTFAIDQSLLPASSFLSTGIHQSAGTVSEIEVQNYPALLVEYANGRIKLQILFHNIFVDMSGDVNKEEMSAIANSFNLR